METLRFIDGDAHVLEPEAGDQVLQEGRFLARGLHQCSPQARERYFQRHAWQAGAAADISNYSCLRRQQRPQLRRIENMPAPNVLEAAGADQIDFRLPFLKQGDIGPQPFKVFAGDSQRVLESFGSQENYSVPAGHGGGGGGG